MSKEKYTWYFIDACCKELAKRIKGDGQEITHVVGVSRGGLIPAVLLAKELEVREVISLGLKSYNDGDDYKTRVPIPKVYQDIKSCYQLVRGDSNILVVDDITDKGNTFKYIADQFKEMSACINYKTAAIFRKPDSDYHPDYVSTTATPDEWVVFPWEK